MSYTKKPMLYLTFYRDAGMSDEKASLTDGPQPDELSQIAEQAKAPVSEQGVKRSRLIGRLFLFPLAIVVVGVVLSLVLALLTSEDQTPRTISTPSGWAGSTAAGRRLTVSPRCWSRIGSGGISIRASSGR